MSRPIEAILSDALHAVNEAIELHRMGKNAPLSITLLSRVKGELEKMHQSMDPRLFKPAYPRFVLDWPDETGLIKLLVEASYEYGKLKGKR